MQDFERGKINRENCFEIHGLQLQHHKSLATKCNKGKTNCARKTELKVFKFLFNHNLGKQLVDLFKKRNAVRETRETKFLDTLKRITQAEKCFNGTTEVTVDITFSAVTNVTVTVDVEVESGNITPKRFPTFGENRGCNRNFGWKKREDVTNNRVRYVLILSSMTHNFSLYMFPIEWILYLLWGTLSVFLNFLIKSKINNR